VFTERFQSGRAAACARAADELTKLGFRPDETARWHGRVEVGVGGEVPLELVLPERFPDCLPSIYVDRKRLSRRIPHVDRNSKLCIAAATGILIDRENPEGIIEQSLRIASRTLSDGLLGRNEDDFKREFVAYWNGDATIISLCDPDGPAREISVLRLGRDLQHHGKVPHILITDDVKNGERLGRLLGASVDARQIGFFAPLTTPFMPPDFEDALSTKDVRGLLHDHCSPETWEAFRNWLGHPVLPAVVVLSMPNLGGRTLIAVQFETVSAQAREQARRGFRADRLPAWRELQFAPKQAVSRLNIARYDASFLLPRGGAMESLHAMNVAVIGCGSVGSHVIQQLASLGIGHFRLVDKEAMDAYNLYRHALGIKYIGVNKAEAMCDDLVGHYPEVDSQFRAKDAEDLLTGEPGFILDTELLVIALGDETLELHLNQVLGPGKRRIHAWVDPLGIGGHALATGISAGPGCFRCLFQRIEDIGLTNRASFAKAGQSFQKSFAGCSGTFTPFASVDADRTAIEVARLAVNILSGKESQNSLLSWYGDPTHFHENGFELSERAQLFRQGECRRESGFASPECPHCRDWR
jgi:hypothetical protein